MHAPTLKEALLQLAEENEAFARELEAHPEPTRVAEARRVREEAEKLRAGADVIRF